MSKSNYSYVISEEVLCITDHNGPKSVTNNAENVLDEIEKNLKANNISMPDTIIYSDSNGDYDGLEYDGNDVKFYFLNTRRLTIAIDLAKNRYDNL